MVIFEAQPGHATREVIAKECAANFHQGLQALIEQHDVEDPGNCVTPIMLDMTDELHLPHLRIGYTSLDSHVEYTKNGLISISLVNHPVELKKTKLVNRYQYPHIRVAPGRLTAVSLYMGLEAHNAAWRYLGHGLTERTMGLLLQTLTMVDIIAADLNQKHGLQPVL